MRIYFIGSHSTGKTTLARYTADQYGLPLLTEVARLLLAEREITLETLRANVHAVNSYQRGILTKQFEEERRLKNFVSDRSFDNLAYACEHTTIFSDLLARDDLKEYINSLRASNSLIFFIRPCKEMLMNDGVRERVTWDGVCRIDSYIKFMLEMWKLRYFAVNTPYMQERIRVIESVISLVTESEKLHHSDQDVIFLQKD